MKKSITKMSALLMAVLMSAVCFMVTVSANCELKLVSPASLSGNQALDIVSVAQTNLSKTGSQLGATEHWCADFVYCCARKANIGEDIIPTCGRVSTLKDKLIAAGAKEVETAQAGDLVFYGSSHVGIMADSLYAYQGNFSGKGSGEQFWTSSKVLYCKYTSATNYKQYGATFVRPKYKDTSGVKTLTVTYKAGSGSINSDTYAVYSDVICKKDKTEFKDLWTYNNKKKYGLYNAASFGLYKTGYHFTGWLNESSVLFDQDDATVTPYMINPTVKKKSCSSALTASWEINTLSVGYNANGGTLSSTTYSLDSNENILKKKTGIPVAVTWEYNKPKSSGLYNASTFGLKKSGYKFSGWSTEKTGTKIFDQNDSSVVPTDLSANISSKNDCVIMYARWEKLHVHTPVTDLPVEPTCTDTGLTEGSHCSDCGAVIVAQKEVAALGHDFSEEVTVDLEPTCTTDGSSSRHCIRCNEKTDVTVMTAPGHDLKITVKKMTCTSNGYTLKKCRRCTFEEKTDVQKAPGHTYYDNVLKKATFAEEGKVSNECAVCGKVKKTYATAPVKDVILSNETYIYTTKNKKPDVTVTDANGKNLVNGTDFKLTYPSESKMPGKYKVKVKLTGKYSGSKTVMYFILPRIVKGVSVTSNAKKTVTVKYNTVTGATGYEIYYSTSKNGVYKRLATTKLTEYTNSKLTSGKTYYFKIRAYKYAANERHCGSFSKKCKVKIL